MKIRADILRIYREVHSWVGICTGLLLFVSFFAGAISMFEQPLRSMTAPPAAMPPPTSLARTPDLLSRVFASYPQARKNYTIVLTPDRILPGRVAWPLRPPHGPDPGPMLVATLGPDGILVVRPQPTAPAAHFIDVLHQRVGLPLPERISTPVMGVVALLYSVALISGTIIFLPALVRTLFAFRPHAHARRFWLDLHNLLGFCSLPFHIVMAITSVVFAFHDQIFLVQNRLFAAAPHVGPATHHQFGPPSTPLAPEAILAALAKSAPGFTPTSLTYSQNGHGALALRVAGEDRRYSTRGPTSGFVTLNPLTGQILSSDYLPGHQATGFAVLTVFFALHFGSFGGTPVRWGYVILGLIGAGLFHTGNMLWIESRRRRERTRGLTRDTLPTRILSRLTPGWTIGTIAGCATVLMANALFPSRVTEPLISALYYAVLSASIIIIMIRPVWTGKPLERR